MSEFKFPAPTSSPARELIFGLPVPTQPLLPNPEPLVMLDEPAGSRSFGFSDIHYSCTAGKLFFNDNVPKPSIKGLVVMCHGARNTPLRYTKCFDLVGAHLAANGFIAVSVNHTHSGDYSASDDIVSMTRHVMNRFQGQFGLTGKPLALIGHSEGASGALMAGKRIPSEVGEHFKSVRAIVALAPTGPNNVGLTNGCCESLLVLGATHDIDSALGGTPLREFHSAYVAQKYFGWLHGCNHASFLVPYDDADKTDAPQGKLGEGDVDSLISAMSTQGIAVANYATMFILWHLSSGGKYRAIFNGEKEIVWKSQNLSSTNNADFKNKLRFYPRYQGESYLSLGLGSLPVDVKFAGLYDLDLKNAPIWGPFPNRLSSMKYEKVFGFLVRWDKKLAPAPSMSVKCTNSELAVKTAKAIEFDAIQIVAPGVTLAPVKLQVSIKHAYGTSAVVDVNIEPSLWLNGQDAFLESISSSMLCTVRIPMALFMMGVPAHIQSMQEVRLSFSLAPPVGTIAITGFRAMLI